MFSVIRGGCFSRHSLGFTMERPHGLPHYVLLIIKTYAELDIEGIHKTCKPNSALLIKPDTPYSYKNPHGEYIDDWIHFTCTTDDLSKYDASIFHNGFPINNTGVLTTYIHQMLWENHFSVSPSKESYIDTLFRLLLNHIYEDFNTTAIEEYNPYRYKLQRLRLEIQAAPYRKYTAEEIAADLKISASYFQYLYKLFFDISFHADIINMRIEYTKELITTTDLPLEQIAYSSGYSSEVHFYRQFLSKTGMTPGEYRHTYFILKPNTPQ